MKNLSLLFAAFLLSLATLAQTPASPKGGPMGINYQTVIRDGDGNILPDTELSLQMTIRSGAPDGAVVYQETHDATTNAFGLVNLVIGYGTPLNNAFADINWGNGDKYLETAIDLNGSGSFTIMGVTQFLSVPYALHSGTAETFEETDPEFNAWDKSAGIAITENQVTDLQDYLTAESDPEFNTWDKSTGIAISENQITDLQDYLTAENDPEFNAWDKSTGITITENQITDLQDYLTAESDPDFNAWDKSTGIAITESQVTDLQDYLTEELDGDPVNELQVVEEQDYEVTLSQGGGSFMTGVKSYTQPEIDAMTPYNGLTVHNATTNCINYYYLNNWFEACGICTPQPTQAAAGDDQVFYDETTEASLVANTPENGTGLWTLDSGEGGSFDDASLPDATFNGQPCTAYTLAWTISNSCGESSDQVDVTFFAMPTLANAGNDTIVESGDLSVNLNAKTPDIGNGLWSVLSGEGGTFDIATNPTTLFTGLPYVEYTLLWVISTACDTTSDEVNVSFNPFQCGMPLADIRDGNSYETIEIDDQCWMAENLAYLPNVSPSTQGNNTEPYYYVYDYQGVSVTEAKATDNYQNYGAIYNWPSSLDACPEGWHLPTHAEWTVLTDYLGEASVAGGKMKSTRTAPDPHPRWNSPNTGATNSSGFSGFPGGYRIASGSFSNIGSNGYYWSSTEADAASAWYLILNAFGGNSQLTAGSKVWGFSLRCLRD